MSLNIHNSIKEKLDYFYEIKKIPHIIFHGPAGSGKSTIVDNFIYKIYNNNKEQIKSYVMYVNCAHGKGIKFIREELKMFAKTHINSNGGDIFKSIILLNADKLTMDAQSALRRCIELFSHNTRFFIIVEDKYKLLKPILSRFCEIYVPELEMNLYSYNLESSFHMDKIKEDRKVWLKKELIKYVNIQLSQLMLIDISLKLYEKGYSAIDIIDLLEEHSNFNNMLTLERRYELLVAFGKVKKEFRNEKLLIIFILNFLFLDREINLENISYF
jgi:hypothetical protein